MNRLLQGDVGSGKTVVAAAAIAHSADCGFQSAFMAPTEILAEQHLNNLQSYLNPLGMRIRLLVGKQRKEEREEILKEIAAGETDVVVGTHALIQDAVTFSRLGLAVVDEQHRFGVMQRAEMVSKGQNPHILLMTATPIPRSLAMTLYGDLDVSLIRERPPGRTAVQTRLYGEKQRAEMYRFVDARLRAGAQAYVVFPLVEESEKLDLRDAQSGADALRGQCPDASVDLIHGRMASDEKTAIMARFKEGATDILVATTVIEVGVDVPNASLMIIEHAERFGLSQLHQLRGRVGRGSERSYCLLMADYARSAEARTRLEAMVRTDDGFEISEIDLKLRGAGDFFGTRQSGLPDLRIADLVQDTGILAESRDAARGVLEADPKLASAHNRTMAQYFDAFYSRSVMRLGRVG
jgi:ATP-dependent DNA helicase RecG